MGWTEQTQIEKARGELVIKDNRIIQEINRRKYELTTREQKIVGYLLSLIERGDEHKKPPHIYTFDISTFCDICGIDKNSGSNLQAIKATLKELHDHGFYIRTPRGGELLFSWVSELEILPGEGSIEIEIPTKSFSYLAGLTEKFTEYELWQVLPLKSAYSIALFELLKSYSYKRHPLTVSLEQLRAYLGIPEDKYKDFRNFQRKVLDVAKKEINGSTDITIDWRGIRNGGRSYTHIEFTIETKSNLEVVEVYRRSKALINGIKHQTGQLNIFE